MHVCMTDLLSFSQEVKFVYQCDPELNGLIFANSLS